MEVNSLSDNRKSQKIKNSSGFLRGVALSLFDMAMEIFPAMIDPLDPVKVFST